MFGFSLGKLLLLVFLVLGSWVIITKIQGINRIKNERDKKSKVGDKDKNSSKDDDISVEDLIFCKRCGTHHTAGDCKLEED